MCRGRRLSGDASPYQIRRIVSSVSGELREAGVRPRQGRALPITSRAMSRIAFLGAGRMASAMVNGILKENLYSANEIICADADDGTGSRLSEATGIAYSRNLEELLQNADTVVLAFKPQQLSDIGPRHAELATGRLIISILAGMPLPRLQHRFPKARNVVRSMPNTPGQIGAGITCYSTARELEGEDARSVESILGSLGVVLRVDETELDAVTALSGSGPAYLFEFVAALRDGGISAGLSTDMAYRLALETTLGASRLLAGSGERPETLRDWVSSPGGTTLAGLKVMEESDFRGILRKTVLAARDRSLELASAS